MYTPSFTPGVNTLYCSEEWRGEQRISPPGDKIHPWGTTSPPGSKFAPRGEVENGPQDQTRAKKNCTLSGCQAVSLSADDKRRSAEIDAAVRTLKTNLALMATLVLIYITYFGYLTDTSVVSVYKALIPVLTTVANFGKVQEVVEKYANHFSPRAHILTK
jgi:hypothetical protein